MNKPTDVFNKCYLIIHSVFRQFDRFGLILRERFGRLRISSGSDQQQCRLQQIYAAPILAYGKRNYNCRQNRRSVFVRLGKKRDLSIMRKKMHSTVQVRKHFGFLTISLFSYDGGNDLFLSSVNAI